MADLKPCSCGGRAVILGDMVQTWVQCEECGRKSKARLDPQSAVYEWNKETDMNDNTTLKESVSPCAGCRNRFIGCHSQCDDFIAWQKDKLKINELKRQNAKDHNQFDKSRRKIRWRRWH